MQYLVVDDDTILATMLSRALTRQGWLVTTSTDAAAALQACQKHRFDRAVVDLKLAHSSGLQLIPHLLEVQPHLQIVMLTGYSSIATAVEAIKQGAVNYLCKPVNVEELLAAFAGRVAAPMATETFTPPSVERLEWEHIQRVLHENHGNISATARALGMHRRTLQRKLQKYPVRR